MDPKRTTKFICFPRPHGPPGNEDDQGLGEGDGGWVKGNSLISRSLTSDLWPLTSGFSLIEVTLALMVMAVGILSIMGLFPAGLDQNERSIADTHAAFFAEEVFAGLHARAETNWDELANIQLPVACSNLWGYIPPVHATNYPDFTTITYKYPTDPYYEDHSLRYRLVVMTNGPYLKAATLFVWPGAFGSTNDPGIFYTEFFGWKP